VSSAQSPTDDLAWLLDEFTQRSPWVSHAVVVSTDGLLLCRSRGLPEEPAQELTTLTAGLLGLTQDAAFLFEAGAVLQTIVEMAECYLFLAAIGNNSCLAAIAANDCEIGLVGHELALLVGRLGKHLTPPRRAERSDGNSTDHVVARAVAI
jgi:hypothetical protein